MIGIGTWTVAGALGATVLGVTAIAASPLGIEASPGGTFAPVVQEFDGEEGQHGRCHGHRGERRAEIRAEVAAALGVSVEDFAAAVEVVKQTIERPEPPLTPEQRLALRDEVHAALAAELGVTQGALEAAHDQLFEARLQAKVDDGTLTAEEAAEIRVARENGTLADLMKERGTERVQDHLDQALADGRITQERYDELQQAIEEGDFRGRFHDLRHNRQNSGTFFDRGVGSGGGAI